MSGRPPDEGAPGGQPRRRPRPGPVRISGPGTGAADIAISAASTGMAPSKPHRPGPVALTILAGLDQHAVGDVATGLLLRVPRLALVWADPFTAELGYIQTRVSDSDGRCTERSVDLEHGCLSCAMREGVIAAVRGLARTGRYDTILIHLHPGIEADAAIAALSAALKGTARVDIVVTVLSEQWLDLLASDATAADRGIAVASDDDRTAATILAADLETATVLVASDPAAGHPTLDEHAALCVLAPDAARIAPATPLDIDPDRVLHTGRYDPDTHDRFARRGLFDPHLDLPSPAGGVRLVRWSSRRPIHPARLHAALDQLADGVIRSSGYLWFATRPELVVGWDSAGDCLQLGPDGLWLTPPPGRSTPFQSDWQPSPAQRAHAARAADPYYGDRANLLAFLGDDLEADHIHAVLSECLLTDDELAAGIEGWHTLDDPFPDWSEAFTTQAASAPQITDEHVRDEPPTSDRPAARRQAPVQAPTAESSRERHEA